MPTPLEYRTSRGTALLVVAGLHVIGALLIGRAVHSSRAPLISSPALVWLNWADSPRQTAAESNAPAPVQRSRSRPPAATAVAPVVTVPAAPHPSAPAVDWSGEARRSATAAIDYAARERRRNATMGSTPKSPYASTPERPQFQWSHQPLGKHVDFDPHTGLLSFRSKRCVIVFFLIVPGFACAPGPIDPEPGRGDLFDPKYRSQPLELPASLPEKLQQLP